MTTALYELRFYRQGREVPGLQPAHERLDLGDVDATFTLLDRHLVAAAEYAGERLDRAHLFEVAVYRTDHDQRSYGDPVLRRRLPVDEEGARRWR